jgi:hypothetical protein
MSRLPAVTRDELSPEHQQVWDRIAAVRIGVRTGAGGPFGVLIVNGFDVAAPQGSVTF